MNRRREPWLVYLCATLLWFGCDSAEDSPATDASEASTIDAGDGLDAAASDGATSSDANTTQDAMTRFEAGADASRDAEPDGGASCTVSACRLGQACDAPDDCPGAGVCENSVCTIEGYAFVPSGTFTMGAPINEPGRHEDRENGQHTVTITRPMLVKKTTVTQGEWKAVFGNNPSYHGCGDECPVELVDWWEMVEYADALSAREGLTECYQPKNCTGTVGEGCGDGDVKCRGYVCDRDAFDFDLSCDGYRLPTEAEWEYFARAGTQTAFITASGEVQTWFPGNGVDPELASIAWYAGNSETTYSPASACADLYEGAAATCGPHPVAQKSPNAWGLYDITGNVWERVWDRSGSYPEPGTSVVDPKAPAIFDAGTNRRIRGGPFNAYGQYMRVAYRSGPGDDARLNNIGFRLVRSVPAPQ